VSSCSGPSWVSWVGLKLSKRTPRWPSLSTSSADLKATRIYTTLRDITSSRPWVAELLTYGASSTH
jgi:hypothetical protein